MDKKVSIIVPTKNEEKNIASLVNSIQRQNKRIQIYQKEYIIDLEVIIIDSGSTDKTIDILLSLNKKYQNIKIFETPKFHHSITRNLGAKLARGGILVYVNADALPANRKWLSELIRPLLSSQRIAASYSRQIPPKKYHFEFSRILMSYPPKSSIITRNNFYDFLERYGVLFSTVSCAINKEIFKKIGGFNKQLFINEDQDLAIRLLKLGYKIAYISSSLVIHGHMDNFLQMFARYYRFGQGWKIIDEIHGDLMTRRHIFGRRVLNKLLSMISLSVKTCHSMSCILSTIFGFILNSTAFVLGNVLHKRKTL